MTLRFTHSQMQEASKPKISIIGAGISGLTTGCYLQMNGFETQIFEKHNLPGGLCTNWQKGEYTFDGSVHWILGSDKGSGFYHLWSELLDLDKIPFHNHKVRLEVEVKNTSDKYGHKRFRLFTNLEEFQAYIDDIAPEDSNTIRKFIQKIRILQEFDVPPLLEKLPIIPSIIRGIKMMRFLRFLKAIMALNRMTNYSLAKKLQNAFLKESFELLFDGDEVSMLVLAFPMASFDKKSAGYPIGGSLQWAKYLEESYLNLGGKIHYSTPVREIIVENNEAKALLVRNNKVHESDAIISCSDWHHTVFDLLKGKYIDKKQQALADGKSFPLFYSVLLVSFGVKIPLKDQAHFFRFPIDEKLVSPCGTDWDRLEVHIYNYDPTLAPEGKVSVACSFYTTNGQYWIDLRKNNRAQYRIEKEKFAQKVAELVDKKIPGFKESVEVIDFATPASTLRYTNSWKGSAQGWLPKKNFLKPLPIQFQFPGLKKCYYASHWSRPGGGLPIAISIGRDVAKKICKDFRKPFIVNGKKY